MFHACLQPAPQEAVQCIKSVGDLKHSHHDTKAAKLMQAVSQRGAASHWLDELWLVAQAQLDVVPLQHDKQPVQPLLVSSRVEVEVRKHLGTTCAHTHPACDTTSLQAAGCHTQTGEDPHCMLTC